MHYSIGDTIVYSAFGGEERTIIVEEKESDIKNGRPGFSGSSPDGNGNGNGWGHCGYWGYDSQIIRVIRKEKK